MNELPLDFGDETTPTGFRLERLELLNWGTFHRKVWVLEAGGRNTLVTGDIGSGKSTLVDAITTLLVPANRVAYNKAAGAEGRERDLRSYFLGYYKSARDEESSTSRPVALRDHNSHSVLLAVFHNPSYDLTVTLAQFFWSRDPSAQPSRFYVVAEAPLTITEHFSRFGGDVAALKRRLRRLDHLELFDSFPPYGAAFRRRLGIDNEQALELFHQTVSMKSVGNLTHFVRQHMLEGFDSQGAIQALVHHFDDLDRAHQAVLKARDQIQRLQPLVAGCRQHAELSDEVARLRHCRDALHPWFAQLKGERLEERLVRLTQEAEKLRARLEASDQQRQTLRARRDRLTGEITRQGGDRLAAIAEEQERLEQERLRRQGRAQRYRELAEALQLPFPADETAFVENRQQARKRHEALPDRQAEIDNRLTETQVQFAQLRRRHEELTAEIQALRHRRSNIDPRQMAIRDALCQALDLDPDTMPFAGELIRVREEEQAWEGAAERLLHNFALSLLVPDQHYPQVARWVDQTHLNGRLVYYRVRRPKESEPPTLHPHSLVRKLELRADSPFYSWLEQALARRFDYACCTELAQFQRERNAITPQGQIKSAGQRHEKDDRHALDDRRRYQLGWSNQAKIAALQQAARELETRMQALAEELSREQQHQQALRQEWEWLVRLMEIHDYQELAWEPLAQRQQALAEEARALREGSHLLQSLSAELETVEAELKTLEEKRDRLNADLAANGEKQHQANLLLEQCRQDLAALEPAAREAWFPQLEALRDQALGEVRLTVENCDRHQQRFRAWLQGAIDKQEGRRNRLGERLVRDMQAYRERYPLETDEVDASLEAADAWQAMLQTLEEDGLPNFEARFKTLLRENTIREVAAFQSRLYRERQTIAERIETINRSLRQIDYNPGRYIELELRPTTDAEVRDFQHDLRACIEGSLTGSEEEQYSEAKFLQVKAIIERFKGREGSSELDRRWTRKVTDVRNWFLFSASERWREDGREYEHYTDSGGKSGGQKEKLAYTVLAASLAYQFGLEWGERRSRSFRFVVIDEAFGRGSDESARYALSLFERLGLQLLIVTPLQKIHVIEPYVAAVGFIHNENGQESLLRNLTIEEYRQERARRQEPS